MTTIRSATIDDAAALAEVQFAAWRETYARMLPREVLDRLPMPVRAQSWRRRLAAAQLNRALPRIYLAEQEGWTVGFVDGGRCRDAALANEMPAPPTSSGHTPPPMEVYELYLLDAVKRQGIGGRLLRTIARDFVGQGAVAAGVWVLGDNDSARAFYERFGASAVAEKIERVGGFEVHEVGYVWRDLARAFLPGL
jgi:ribosomal protein S18 acetylase RimI-like enzyme